MNTNQLIHERLMGECWHELGKPFLGAPFVCAKCQQASISDLLQGNPKYDADLNKCFAA